MPNISQMRKRRIATALKEGRKKHIDFTFNCSNTRSAAIFFASFMLELVADAVAETLSPFTFASTKYIEPFSDTEKGGPQEWYWQSSCSSLIGLSCKVEKLMIGSRKDSVISHTRFKLKPVSSRIEPTHDSTKSPRAWKEQIWIQN